MTAAREKKRPWPNLVVWLVAVIFIFSDIFTDGQCLDKTLSGILKMENKYRVGMGVLLLLNILVGENGTQVYEVVKMHFIYINIQEYINHFGFLMVLNQCYVRSHGKVGKSSTTKCGVASSGN